MNKIEDIKSLSFVELSKTTRYFCVSGRIKYDETNFSIKCRIEGIENLEQKNQAKSIKIEAKEASLVFTDLEELTFDWDSSSVSLDEDKTTSKYLVQGKGKIEGA